MIDDKREEHVNKVEVDNRRKCFHIVDHVGLSEAMSN